MAIRMGYWDCPGCDNTKIPGPERQCSNCGRPRDVDIQFYTTDDAPEVSDAALLERAAAGADWQCPYCGADNVATASQCIGCGAAVDGAEFRQQRFIPNAPPQPVLPKRRRSNKNVWLVLLGLALVVGATIWALFLRTKPLEVEVTQVTWVKTLDVERLVREQHSGWADEAPSSGRIVSRTTKARSRKVQDGTERVKVGQRDLGNGLFEDVYEDRPRYVTKQFQETWLVWEVERWKRIRTLAERRQDGSEPPEPRFVGSAGERAGSRGSTVELALRADNGETYTHSISPSDLRTRGFAAGKKYTAMINAMGGVKSIE